MCRSAWAWRAAESSFTANSGASAAGHVDEVRESRAARGSPVERLTAPPGHASRRRGRRRRRRALQPARNRWKSRTRAARNGDELVQLAKR